MLTVHGTRSAPPHMVQCISCMQHTTHMEVKQLVCTNSLVPPRCFLQATAAVEANAELVAAAQKLVQLSQQHAAQADIDRQTELVSDMSKAAGTNVVVEEINDGTFKGYTLSVSWA